VSLQCLMPHWLRMTLMLVTENFGLGLALTLRWSRSSNANITNDSIQMTSSYFSYLLAYIFHIFMSTTHSRHVLRHESLLHDIIEGRTMVRLHEVGKECTCWATWWWKYVALKRTAEDRKEWQKLKSWKSYTCFLADYLNHHHHNRFTALFPGPPRWAGARRELLDFMVHGKTNRGRTIQLGATPSGLSSEHPHHPMFYRPDALPVAQPTVSKHWRQPSRLLEEGRSWKWLYIPIVVGINQ